nr:uncharacterized protein LOC129382465 isoform X2 [Dermacentor andersoni]
MASFYIYQYAMGLKPNFVTSFFAQSYKLHATLGNGTDDPGPYMEVPDWPGLGEVTKKLWRYSYPGQCAIMLYPWLGKTQCEIHIREQGIPSKYIDHIYYICDGLFWELCRGGTMHRIYSSNCSSL